MIEERAVVTQLQGEAVWVRPMGPRGCWRCEHGQGCGAGRWGRSVARSSRVVLRARSRISGLQVGDTVAIGVQEAAVLNAALAVYLAPLLAMFGLGMFADRYLEAGDLMVAAFGFSGLAAGFVVSRWFSHRAQSDQRYVPLVLRRIDASDCVVTAA